MTGHRKRILIGVCGVLGVSLVVATLSTRPVAQSSSPTAYPTPLNYWYAKTQVVVVATIAAENCGKPYFGTQCK